MIPFTNLKRQQKSLSRQLDPAIRQVMESGRYILGEEVETFEKNFADYTGVSHCIGVASGTDAITLALMALDIGSGDEVITTALTAYPTITGIERSGATPIVADVDIRCGLIDPLSVNELITPQTKAIVAVHLYGKCCDMVALQKIANDHDIALVEDCAQATGVSVGNKKAGSVGTIGCFSFYPTKNLGAFGDGGAVVTSSETLATRLQMLRNYGQKDRYQHQINGLNSRLDEIQAAILNIKLPRLDQWNHRRREIATSYQHAFASHFVPLSCEKDHDHVYHLFAIRTKQRDAFIKHMDAHGIQTLIHYPLAIHKQPAMQQHLARKLSQKPNAEQLVNEVVSIPLYPELTDDEVSTIINTVIAAPK